MYSRPLHSSVTVPSTPSRKVCAAAACAASSRPATTTLPSTPCSIENIVRPPFRSRPAPCHSCRRDPQRDQAFSRVLRVAVFDRVRHAADEVQAQPAGLALVDRLPDVHVGRARDVEGLDVPIDQREDRKSTRLNSSHMSISYAVFCLKKKKKKAK